MAFDRTKIAPAAQAAYRKIGARHDSESVRAQAERTRKGANKIIASHGPRFAPHGVAAATIVRLDDLMVAHGEATTTREHARTYKKVTNIAHQNAIFDAKGTRLKLHSAYANARTTLFEAGEQASVDEIDVALNRTRSAGDDTDLLVSQLEILVAPLKKTPIREAVASGDETIPAALETEVTESIATLKSTSGESAAPRGTPVDSELVDLLDGMIIVTCRNIRRAARALSREVGQPALAEEVELNELYKGTKRDKNAGGGGGGPAGG